MSRLVSVDRTALNGGVETEANQIFHNLPETIEKLMYHSHHHNPSEITTTTTTFPVDILHTPKDYVFYMDVPGLSKSDIQVTIEEEKSLVIRSSGKRKREEGKEEEECKYLRLERKSPLKLMRMFRLPENADTSAVTAKCENGVLTVVVQKLPPPPKPTTVQIAVS